MMLLWTVFRGSLPLQLIVIAIAGWAAFEGNNYYQRNIGASQVVAKTNTAAETLSEKAVENRARGDVPDALAKLRKRACRDC